MPRQFVDLALKVRSIFADFLSRPANFALDTRTLPRAAQPLKYGYLIRVQNRS